MMTTADYTTLERTLTATLGNLHPVAVAYLNVPPAGVGRFQGTLPSGCSFWRLAAQGQSLYTVPADHFNCPIGSFTHAIELPPERGAESEATLSLMTSTGYLRMEEVPTMPRLARQPQFVYYAPLAATVVDPDVVIFAGAAGRLMRLQEAAARAGVASTLPLLGRPTCMALPAALIQGAVMSTGCIGNRVYTDLPDDELYLMAPGARLRELVEHVPVISAANDTLERYHRERRETLTSKGAVS